MNDHLDIDERIGELLRLELPVPEHREGYRESVAARIAAEAPALTGTSRKKWMTGLRWPLAARAEEQPGALRRASAPRRRSGLRVAVFASMAVVLLAAIAVGSFLAVRNLARPDFVLAIVDNNNISTGSPSTGNGQQSGEWERLPLTSEGAPINVLEMDPTDPAVLYAGTDQGLFKSTDRAATWTPLSLRGRVNMIAVDPRSPSTVYVTAHWTQFKSLDGGATWKQIIDDSSYPSAYKQLWIDASTSPSTLYGQEGYTSGPYKSIDGGLTWQDVRTPEGRVTSLAIDPSGNTLYAAVWDIPGTTLFSSPDGGVSWRDVSAGIPASVKSDYLKVTLDPKDPSRLYLYCRRVTPEGDSAVVVVAPVLVSSDQAQTWSELSGPELDWAKAVYHAAPGTPAEAIEAAATFLTGFDDTVTDASNGMPLGPGALDDWDLGVVIDPGNPSVLYVPTAQGIGKSVDRGATWDKANAGMTDPLVRSVRVDPASPATLYVTTSASIVKSADGGASWTTILGTTGSLALAPSSPSRLYARTPGGLLRSDDGGTTWTRLDASGLPSLQDAGLPLFALFAASGMFVSSDRPDTVFANSADGLYLSTDGGGTWRKATGLPAAAQVVAEAPDDPSTLYAGVYNSAGIFKSTDGGETWAPICDRTWGFGVFALAIDPQDPLTIYAVQENGSTQSTWRSTDGGRTWAQADFKGVTASILSLFFDPRNPGTLYAVTTTDDGILAFRQSTEGGAAWEDSSGGLPQALLGMVVLDPALHGGLYAATGQGLYKWVPSAK